MILMRANQLQGQLEGVHLTHTTTGSIVTLPSTSVYAVNQFWWLFVAQVAKSASGDQNDQNVSDMIIKNAFGLMLKKLNIRNVSSHSLVEIISVSDKGKWFLLQLNR
jgi:hypothetical protein